jgi:hypothetical protein
MCFTPLYGEGIQDVPKLAQICFPKLEEKNIFFTGNLPPEAFSAPQDAQLFS